MYLGNTTQLKMFVFMFSFSFLCFCIVHIFMYGFLFVKNMLTYVPIFCGSPHSFLSDEFTNILSNLILDNKIYLLYLKSLWTVVQKFQHVANVFSVLDHKVELHVELSSNELQYLNIKISIKSCDTEIIIKILELFYQFN